MKQGFFVLAMRIIVNCLNLFPLYAANYELLEWMPNKMDSFIFKFLLNSFIFMALLSYWIASLT
jgi:succinate dehydrogenase/fumarate reductase cytochrome b subunit